MTNLKQLISGARVGNLGSPIETIVIGLPETPKQLISYLGKIFVYNQQGQTLIDGGIVSTRAIEARAVTADKVRSANKQFVSTLTWSSVSYQRASWSSGIIQWSDGTQTSINAGNTGDISQLTYVYYNGTSTLAKTTDYSLVVGSNKVLMAAVAPGVDSEDNPIINTFLSTGTTIDGDKVVTGTIESADGNTYFNLENGRLLISDGTDPRVLFGNLGSFYGVKISRQGYDVTTETDYRNLAFISDEFGTILKVSQQGSVSVTIEDGQTTGQTTISHNLGYFPGGYAFVGVGSGVKARFNFQGSWVYTNGYTGEMSITSEEMILQMTRSGSSGEISFDCYYYLFIENTNL